MRFWSKLEQIGLLLLNIGLGRLYPVIILPILAGRIGPDGMGRYVQLLAIGLIFAQVVEWGFNISGPREIALRSTREAISRVVFNVIFARLLLALAAMLVALAVYFGFANGKFGAAEFFLAILYGISLACDFRFLFYGLNLFRRQIVIQVVQNGLALLLVFVFVRTESDIWMIFLLSFAAATVSLVGSWFALAPEITFGAAARATPIRELGRTFDIFLSRGAVQLMNQVSPLIFGLFYPNAVVGLIGLSEKITKSFGHMTMFVFMQAMVRDLARLVQLDRARAFKLFLWGNGLVLLLCAAFVGVTAVFADPIITILFGKDFLPMRDYLLVYLVFCAPFTLSRTFGFYWLFLNKLDRTNTYITMAFLVAYLLMLVVLSGLFPPFVPLSYVVGAWAALFIFYVVYIFANGLHRSAPPPSLTHR